MSLPFSTPIPFGQYRGKAFNSSDVPERYRLWMSRYHDGLLNLNNRSVLQELLQEYPIQSRMYCAQGFLWLVGHHQEFNKLAREYVHAKHQCLHCGQGLVAIGHARSNGADHTD